MTKPMISVLTNPISWGQELLYENGRKFARFARSTLQPQRQYFNHPIYRGHFAVTRSLVEGLKSIDANFNYNPAFPWDLAETVIVLAGVRTLRQAIKLKRQGRIKRLLAGPNIVVFSSDYDSILASAEIDTVVTPCDFVSNLYIEDNPSIAGRTFSWPAGVDCNYWKPEQLVRQKKILIYEKQNKGPVGPVLPYAEYMRSLGWEVDILQYGSFFHYEYLEKLQNSCLMLGFVTDESQGIAWAEAWAADVPTLIWNNTSQVLSGRRYDCSTAPYLNCKNGLFFDDLFDFKIQFEYWAHHRNQFSPRDWVLKNMSDEVCASLLYERALKC